MRRVSEGLDRHEELAISLDVLEEESERDNPRMPVIQGMLSNFTSIPEFQPFVKQIAAFYEL
ncbi:hypothetical protein B0X71_00985 [Planococcus lenghuensis]|uniref:Uncharacterized protein n=2 Tax=Planococcus lenghuensis TaxID=2213202 RepID=A0A1Q2KUG3_9BACL|nr:hypothetical protein B0X71_00985 [Planococcus lenghuensis]